MGRSVRGVDVAPGLADLLDQGEPLRGLARESREVGDDDAAALARPDPFEDGLERRPVERPARAVDVLEDLADLQTPPLGEGPGVALLLLGRDQVLPAPDAGDPDIEIH